MNPYKIATRNVLCLFYYNPLWYLFNTVLKNTPWIGQMLEVSVTWDLNLPGILFYLRDCDVQQGSSSVSVVQGGCFAEALKESLEFHITIFGPPFLSKTLFC